jgi:hypothetical protein
MAKLSQKKPAKKAGRTSAKKEEKRKGKSIAPPQYGVKLADKKRKKKTQPKHRKRLPQKDKNSVRFILKVPFDEDHSFERLVELQKNIYAIYDKRGYDRDLAFQIHMRLVDHFRIIDKLFNIPLRSKKGQVIKYQVSIGLPNGPLGVKLLYPKWKVARSPEEIAEEERLAEQREKELEEMDIPEAMKEALENTDEIIGRIDGWALKWGEFFAGDFQSTQRIEAVRKAVKKYHGPISKTLKYGKITEEGARFVYQLQNAMEYEPGTKAAAEKFAQLAEPAGELLDAISKVAPPGMSHFLKALGEAGKMAPAALAGMKHKLDPKQRWRHREEWKYL